MFQFDWTITLGNILSTLLVVTAFIGGAYKFVVNHLEHLDTGIAAQLVATKAGLAEQLAATKESLALQLALTREGITTQVIATKAALDQHTLEEMAAIAAIKADVRQTRDYIFALSKQTGGG